MRRISAIFLFKTHLKELAVLGLLVLSTGCAKSGTFQAGSEDGLNQVVQGTSPAIAAAPTPAAYVMEDLAWTSPQYPERNAWSQYLENIILTQWSSLLAGASDITQFCPTYNTLDNNHRANVWAALFSAVSKYESGFEPTSRMVETTLGTDPVTGLPVYSEGLLQLSYQDILVDPFCGFNWSADRSLSPTDPHKTILDPFKNLYCGTGIMAKQIQKHGSITLGSSVYWSTLQIGGRYQKISQIEALVQQLPSCQ